jgi:hypothetical protein
VLSGSQQQFLVRNSTLDGWSNGLWNQVFSGDVGAPAQDFGSGGQYTTLAASPVSEEEPFLQVDSSGNDSVFVPAVQHDSVGPSWASGPTPGTAIGIRRFFIATPSDPVLLQVGSQPGAGRADAAAPTAIQDVFFRIGGAATGRATTSLEVNSSQVILDDIWAWRADHGTGVGWTGNVGDTGVVVNGDHVTAYGLFVEADQEPRSGRPTSRRRPPPRPICAPVTWTGPSCARAA